MESLESFEANCLHMTIEHIECGSGACPDFFVWGGEFFWYERKNF